MTREEWLTRAAERLLVLITDETGLEPPERFQVSVGFPGVGSKAGTVVGVCYVKSCGSGVHQLFISPLIKDPVQVLGILLHELIHACDDCASGHKGAFYRAWHKLGFAGKPTESTVEKDTPLYERLQALSADLGGYPFLGLSPGVAIKRGDEGGVGDPDSSAPKKQTTRMKKCSCGACGYTIRITRKWLDVATPTCPNPECELVGWELTIEEKEQDE